MQREIVHDEAFLKLPSEPCTPEDLPLYDDLVDTLLAHKDECVGMAANMIGVRKNAIVFLEEDSCKVMFNPVIVDRSGPYETKEGCLSWRGIHKALRYREITVTYQDKRFRSRIGSYSGFTAQIIQHEVDHLSGIAI